MCRIFLQLFVGIQLLAAVGLAQQATTAAAISISDSELGYFRSLFLKLGSGDLRPEVVAHERANFIMAFGLDNDEVRALDTTLQSIGTVVQQIRQTQKMAATAGALSATNTSAQIALLDQRDQAISNQAAQLLAAFRPSTTAGLRAYLAASRGPKKGGN